MLLAGILASFPLRSLSYYVLELRGGSHIYATDMPVRKGRLTLFHRYPDGALMSLSSSEVLRFETAQEPPPAAAAGSEKLAPGDVRYIGGALHGPGRPAPEHPAPAEPPAYGDSGYGGYADYGYGYWGGGTLPPPRPVPPPGGGPNIGPNGFPIIAPPGSPGSVPPPIGPNGYPILAPQPPVAAPRRPS
jgi:hypothetical protein